MHLMRVVTIYLIAMGLGGCGGGGSTDPIARCQYDSSLAWNDPKCVSPIDTRPLVRSLFIGSKDVNGVWYLPAENVPYSLRFAHSPCTIASGTNIGLPLAAVLANGDSSSMAPMIFDLESSDTTVIAFANIRTAQLATTFKRPGTTTIIARYRDGMSISKVVVVGDAFYPGPGQCYANNR